MRISKARHQPRIYLWLLVGSLGLGGLLNLLTTEVALLGLAMILINIALVYAWCKSHAMANGVEEPSYAAVLCAVIPPIGVPLYFIRAFGVKNGIRRSLAAFGFSILLALAYEADALLSRAVGLNSAQEAAVAAGADPDRKRPH